MYFQKVEGSVKDRLGTITKPAESPLVKAGDVKPEEDVKAVSTVGSYSSITLLRSRK